MFILPPNCIVPSATSLTMSPVFPNFLYFISRTPSLRTQTKFNSSLSLAIVCGDLCAFDVLVLRPAFQIDPRQIATVALHVKSDKIPELRRETFTARLPR